MVAAIIGFSVHSAVFGLLAVLDGVRAINGRYDDGQLVLSFEGANGGSRLNGENREMLHNIYQAKAYDEVFGKEN